MFGFCYVPQTGDNQDFTSKLHAGMLDVSQWFQWEKKSDRKNRMAYWANVKKVSLNKNSNAGTSKGLREQK